MRRIEEGPNRSGAPMLILLALLLIVVIATMQRFVQS
jgi:hypothetical protein